MKRKLEQNNNNNDNNNSNDTNNNVNQTRYTGSRKRTKHISQTIQNQIAIGKKDEPKIDITKPHEGNKNIVIESLASVSASTTTTTINTITTTRLTTRLTITNTTTTTTNTTATGTTTITTGTTTATIATNHQFDQLPKDLFKIIFYLSKMPERLLLHFISNQFLFFCKQITEEDPNYEINYFNLYQTLAKRGSLKQLKLLQKGIPYFISTIEYNFARKCHFDELKWLFSNFKEEVGKLKNNSTPMAGAIAGGNVNIVKWLVKMGSALNAGIAYSAAEWNKSEILDWFIDRRNGGKVFFKSIQNGIFNSASKNGSIEILEWLENHGYKFSHLKDFEKTEIFEKAYYNNQKEAIYWFIKKGYRSARDLPITKQDQQISCTRSKIKTILKTKKSDITRKQVYL
jgi:hypothetical protein